MNYFAISALICAFFVVTSSADHFCGDWTPFKDEKCLKILDTTSFANFTNAQAACDAHDGAHLLTITSAEEQSFLVSFLYTQKKVVDNLWLGARYSGGRFHLEDGGATGRQAKLPFTNWAPGSPKNREGYCAEMRSEDEAQGKWADEPCSKKNLVVCQRGQTLSLERMRALLFQMRDQLAQTKKTFSAEMSSVKAELSQTQASLRAELNQTEAGLVKAVSSPPLGFIYVQLPKSLPPTTLWPDSAGSWTDVSAEYAGVFFRVTGGDAEAFGSVQGESSPQLEQVAASDCESSPVDECSDLKMTGSAMVPSDGTWSDTVSSANGFLRSIDFTFGGMGRMNGVHTQKYRTGLKFKLKDGEVRPKNMAVKVWKRTG